MARPILIYGPTASGKSALALALAQQLGGAIINADSQQGYACWHILTARPSLAEEAMAPHLLYGHLPPEAPWSAGQWLDSLRGALAKCENRGLLPIVVGGTGLYFRALRQGFASIPPVPADVRLRAEAELQRIGLTDFADAFARRDPQTAAGIDLANPRRVLRAWEVIEATGVPLAEWHARTDPPLLGPDDATAILLSPPRDWLYQRCDARLDAMLTEGVLDEVRAVAAMKLPASLPAMKAVGAREFIDHLDGDLSLDEAIGQAATATRRYAKRQLTWARGQMTGWTTIASTDSDERLDLALAAHRAPIA